MVDKKESQLLIRPDPENPLVLAIQSKIDLEQIDDIIKDGIVDGKPTGRLINNLQAYLSNFVGDIIRVDPTLKGYDIETTVKIQGLLILQIVQIIQFAHIVAQGNRDVVSMTELVKYANASKKIAESIPRQEPTFEHLASSKETGSAEDIESEAMEEITVEIASKEGDVEK